MSNVVNLEDICDILDNKRKPLSSVIRAERIKNKSIDTLFPYYGATQQTGYIDDYIFDEELILLGEDGVLFYDKTKPKAYLIDGKSWVNNHAHVLRVRKDVAITNYVLYYLNTFNYNGYVSGSTRLKLNKSKMSIIPIPLPSLAKQKEIASVLDKAQELIGFRKESIKKLDELSKSVFIDMFGDPVLNPKKFEMIKFGNLGIWKGGGTPSRKEELFFTGNIPWITTVSLGKLFINKNDAVEYITEKAIQKSSTKLIPKNSLIIGVRVGVGKVSINKDDLCTSQDIMALTNVNNNTNIIYAYYFILLYSQIIKDKQRGATIQGITSSVLKEINFTLPPIELQNKFAKIIEKIEEQKSLYEKELNKLEENFKTLLQKSFN